MSSMTELRNNKNVNSYYFGKNSSKLLPQYIEQNSKTSVYFVDTFFKDHRELLVGILEPRSSDFVIYVSADHEPTTDEMDQLTRNVKERFQGLPEMCVGIGGGTALDITKAVSNLLKNPGKAEDYQGWDLLEHQGVFKVGVPTLSGTGAEASRTCVLTNLSKNLKLGMNSRFSVFDQLFLDPILTETVPRDQYFYTGMDTYIHCIESKNGAFRHALADAFSDQAIELCKQVFTSQNMMAEDMREKLMVASYLGGASIANTYVGLVHPFSAALSVVYKTPHCLANCIAMGAMKRFYPNEYDVFHEMVSKQRVNIPKGIAQYASEDDFSRLRASMIVHEKPLVNALGPSFKEVLSPALCKEIFRSM